ncbi:MAG: TPM domain-containing protein [Bacteroidales bacterium]|nr:TPM domain-containing protein [Bacteroidales bacterium]
MKFKLAKTILFLSVYFTSILIIFAQDIPKKPYPPRLVNDFTGTLNKNQISRLEQKLVNFNDTTSTQIAIVLVNSFNGYDKVVFAERLAEDWGVGQKGSENGIVVLLKPKKSMEKGEVWITIGYGLEGAIPDAIVKRIIENEMIPSFQNYDYYQGLDKGTTTLMFLASGEFTADEYKKKTEGSPFGFIIPFIVILIIFTLIRSSGRSQTVGKKNIPFWTALLLGSAIGGVGRHSGSWGSFSGGSGGFGGGGFGGFGGGSFGGGGAGGSW